MGSQKNKIFFPLFNSLHPPITIFDCLSLKYAAGLITLYVIVSKDKKRTKTKENSTAN